MNREKIQDLIRVAWFLLKGAGEILTAILVVSMGLLVSMLIMLGGVKLLLWLLGTY